MNIEKATGDSIETSLGKLTIGKYLGRGKSGYSYLTRHEGRKYVLKLMHYEEVSCYSFHDANKVYLESAAYEKLKSLGIKIPNLVESRPENHFLLKDFVDGPVATELIAGDELPEEALRQLFHMARTLESEKINIDYFPNNFVWLNETLYYIDYEINPFAEDWNLENWGIWYWANSHGMKAFLESGDASAINEDCEKGIPHKDPFREKVDSWIESYSYEKMMK